MTGGDDGKNSGRERKDRNNIDENRSTRKNIHDSDKKRDPVIDTIPPERPPKKNE